MSSFTRKTRRAGVIGGCLASALALASVSAARADAACPSAPRPLCRDLGQTRLAIDASGEVDWRGTRGPATALADFGEPAVTTAYSLCAWDEGGLLVASEIPAAAVCPGGSCWSLRGSSGLRYRDEGADSTGLHALDLTGSLKARTKIRAQATLLDSIDRPVAGGVTLQLSRDDSPICFESAIPADAIAVSDNGSVRAKARFDAAAPVPPLPSAGCSTSGVPPYPSGVSSVDEFVFDGLSRTFRVHVPSSYVPGTPMPVVFLLHGGFGSGAQVETASRMLEVAEAEGFVVVSPDGVAGPGGIRTWNGGGCCGSSASSDIDDVGFIAAVLERVEAANCVDSRRVYATGMSNGSILSHRLACELSDRIRAIGAVAGPEMATDCSPARPVPVLMIHGGADANVPFDGGVGCGAANVSFPSIPVTVAEWTMRDGCSGKIAATSVEGDATCSSYDKCASGNDVELCVVAGGGHAWPGGVPSTANLPNCPPLYQSQSFSASLKIWDFFSKHPAR